MPYIEVMFNLRMKISQPFVDLLVPIRHKHLDGQSFLLKSSESTIKTFPLHVITPLHFIALQQWVQNKYNYTNLKFYIASYIIIYIAMKKRLT